MNTVPKQPPFGWLILGLAYGLVAGHWVAYEFAIPPGWGFRYAERLAMILLIFAFAGSLVAAFFERKLQRFNLPIAWAIWLLVASAYWLVVTPLFDVARE